MHVNLLNKLPTISSSIKPNILSVLGNVGPIEYHKTKIFFDYLSQNFNKILYVPENHEYGSSPSNKLKYESLKFVLRNFCIQYKNVHLLNNDIFIVIDDVTIFIGSTLWSNFTILSTESNKTNYPKYILNCDDHQKQHEKDLNFLKNSIEKYKFCKIIVLTHYSSTIKHVETQYIIKGNGFVSWYVTNLEYMIKHPITHWSSGHVHNISELYINNVYCRLNAHKTKYSNDEIKIKIIEY